MTFQFFNKRHNWGSHIFRAGTRLADLTTDVEVTTQSLVEFNGYVNLAHRGDQSTLLSQYSYTDQERLQNCPVGCSAFIGYRVHPTMAEHGPVPTGGREAPLPGDPNHPLWWVPGAKDGGNIRDLQHHYLTLNLCGAIIVEPAAYRFEPWMFAATGVTPFNTLDSLVCVNTDTGQQESQTFGFMSTKVTPL